MKKFMAAAMTVGIMLLCSACASDMMHYEVRGVEEFEIIQTIGVDYEDGKVIVTAATGTSPSGEVTVLSSEAETMSRAMQQMQNYSSKKYIFFGHTKNFLIGEEAAKNDLSSYLEYVERGIDIRLDTRAYIIQGSTALEAIAKSSEEGESINDHLEALEKDVQLLSESYVFSCGNVTEAIAENGGALAAALKLEEIDGVLLGESKVSVQPAGFGVIDKGKLVGYLSGDEARATVLLINKADSDVIEIPDGEGGYASIELTKTGTDYDAEFENNKLKKIIINVSIKGNISGLENPLNIYEDETIKWLENAVSELEKERIENLLKLSREVESDFLKLGDKLEMKHPIKVRRAQGNNWEEQVNAAEISVNVKTEIERTYDLGISRAEEVEKNNE